MAEHTAATTWGEAPFCLGCGQSWPCDASVLLARIRTLEAGLREYGRHKNDCASWCNPGSDGYVFTCSCGFDALAGDVK